MNRDDILEDTINNILENPDEIIKILVGLVMKKMHGNANPTEIREIIKKNLTNNLKNSINNNRN